MLPWTTKLGIKFPHNVKISHKVTKKSSSSSSNSSASSSSSSAPPLRGIFAESKISKGQLLSIIPLNRSVVLPQTAARYLSTTSSSTSSASSSIYTTALKMTSLNPVETVLHHNPHSRESMLMTLPWFSRDQIMITTALATWKLFHSISSSSSSSSSANPQFFFFNFEDYLRVLPRGIPFSASEKRRQQLLSDESENDNNIDKNKKQQAMNRFSTPLDIRPSLTGNEIDGNMVGATSEEMLSKNRKANTRAVPTSSINMEDALTSNQHLTQMEHIGMLGKSLNFLADNFARAASLSITNNNSNHNDKHINNNDNYKIARSSFEWAHFMVRSRSVCPLLNLNEAANKNTNSEDDDVLLNNLHHQQQPLLIPFVDMFNHNMRDANVTVSWNRGASLANAKNPDDKEILVTALRDIEQGEELTLNYANHKQRGRFMFSPDSIELKLKNKNDIEKQREEEEEEHRRNLREKLYERYPVQKLLTAQRRSGVCEDLLSWEWQYGFPIPKDELEYVRELLWARSLKGRVQRMMDVRRKGRPGEFVVGVPEGLQSLKRHRERIERELYGGRRIFPPQAE